MTDAGEAVLTSAAPRFADQTILGLVTETYGVGGRVLRALNSERDQVVLFGDDERQLVVKLSNEAETATNIDLEESAARWAVAADPGLPLSTPLAVHGSRAHHGVVRHPETGAAHFLRAYDRLPGQAGLVGTDLAPDTVFAYGAVTARTARALRGFFHPAAGRRLLWHVEERDRTRTLAHHIDDPTTRRLVEAAFDGFEERVAPTWAALRAQVVHGDITLDNLLIDDGDVTGVLDLGDLAHSTLVFDIAAAFGSLSATFEGAALFRTLRLFLDGYRSVTPLEPEELAALGDTIAVRAAITLCISHWRAADHPENAAYIRAWDDDLAQPAAAVRGARPRGCHPAPRRAGRAAGDRRPARPPRRGVRHRPGRADVRRAAAPRQRQRSHHDRHQRRDVHRRLQQRPGRRARAPAGQRSDRRPGPAAEHQPALPAPAGHRARRTPGRHDAGRPRHRPASSTPAARRPTWPGGWRRPPPVAPAAWSRTSPTTASPRRRRRCRPRSGAAAGGPATSSGSPRHADPGPTRRPSATPSAGCGRPGTSRPSSSSTRCTPATASSRPARRTTRPLGAAARDAGALVVADEVQAGFGRTGDHLWSFVGSGLVPDVVTLGKPMGNGYPIAAVVTRSGYVEALGDEAEFFSTFAGSPVAAVAALAVLDVIDDGRQRRVWLHHATATPIRRHIKIRGDANPYDPAWEPYLEARESAAMAQALRGRGVLLHLWRRQDGTCTVCDQKITRETGWHCHHVVPRAMGGPDGAPNLVLLHPECHRQVHGRTPLPQGRVSREAFRRLEPRELETLMRGS